MKVGKLNSSQDGIVFDIHGEVQTLSAGHGNVPKIILNEETIQNTLQPRHESNNKGGGRSSMSKKHSWDIVKEVNDESVIITHYGHTNKEPVVSNDCPTLKAQSHGHEQMVIQVTSATKAGFEEAQVGDSINLSNPNSKTRRGRVGVAQTLDTQANQSVLLEGNIRRLTEIECERLQGFKDDHTKFGIYEKKVWINKKEKTFKMVEGVQKISRTQRYKMCGNAVTVDIVELIAVKLLKSQDKNKF